MKGLVRFFAMLAVVAGVAGAILWLDAPLRTQVWLRLEIAGLNTGVIPTSRADWGFLKLRAGQAGLDALSDLEKHSPRPEVRRVAIAVEDQWWEKGHVFRCDGPICLQPGPLDHETRFSELRLPLDGMTLPRSLAPGQVIPQSFWDEERFRVGCNLPPKKWTRSETCTLRMADMTGDSRPEVIVVGHVTGLEDTYVRPVASERWTIFTQGADGWSIAGYIRGHDADLETSKDAHAEPAAGRFDTLWLDGHAIDFFCSIHCRENLTRTPSADLKAAASMAPLLGQIHRLYGNPIPSSLATALAQRTLTLPWDSYMPMQHDDVTYPPRFDGLPPCFVAADPKACMVIVSDLDHDGQDDVIVLERNLAGYDAADRRLATLLMQRNGRWQVTGNRAVCAVPGERDGQISVAFKPAVWRPMVFDGRMYTPYGADDPCVRPWISL